MVNPTPKTENRILDESLVERIESLDRQIARLTANRDNLKRELERRQQEREGKQDA